MNKNTLLWIALGGIVVYLLYSKKVIATPNTKSSTSPLPPPTPSPKDDKKDKLANVTPKEPTSQADCDEGMTFIPAQKETELILANKDGTTRVVKQEAMPAYCWKPRQKGLPLPLEDGMKPYRLPSGIK